MRFIKFASVGSVATAIQYALLIGLVELSGLNAVLASIIAYAVSSIFNYLLNYYFTFESKARHVVASIRFLLVVLCGLAINGSLMYFLVNKLAVYYVVSQVAATIVVLVWNFIAHKFWTYKYS